MTAPSTPPKPFELALEPLELAPPPAETSDMTIDVGVAPTRPSGAAPVVRSAEEPKGALPDRFVTQATREIQDGNLDQRLWSRVLLVSGDDQSQARTAYIRARATMLRLAARDQRAPPEAPAGPSGARPTAAPPADEVPASRSSLRRDKLPLLRMGVATALLGVVAALAWMTFGTPDDPMAARAPMPMPGAPVAVAAKPRDDAATVERAAAAVIAAELETRVKALRDAKNWNVMVLNAAEWTRKQPDNATAWSLLATGYVNLGQLGDAREAADVATRRAPDDAQVWRELGAIDVALDDPERALKSFARATTLDAQDFDSLVQAGNLETQLLRFNEARADFDKALALRAEHEAPLCGLASVARQQGRGAEAETLQKRVKAAGTVCGSGVSVGVRTATTERPGTNKSLAASVR